jgi:glycosyltransferase involved in cell wall biosynthesis
MTERPMRIAYVLSLFHPVESGAERQALAQGKELARRGHQVRVITQMPTGWDLPEREVVGGVLIERVVRPIRVGPLFGLSFVAGVCRELRKRQDEIDLIHTHQALWEAISCGFGRGWLIRRPTLIQPASAGYFGEAEELMRTRGRAVLRGLAIRNTAYVAISEEIERQWLALGVPREKMHRLMSGVDTSRFHPGPSGVAKSMPPGERIVFTGRLHPQKNLDVLLEAWPALLRSRPKARLVLVGDGPERSRLERRARELEIAAAVDFAGAVAEPADYLRAGTAFVLPSRCEGMSNSLLEAMATGLPCLASEVGGNTDLLAGGVGVLLPTDDPAAWARELDRLLGEPARAERMGRVALGLIERDYAIGRVVDRYVELYGSLLERG